MASRKSGLKSVSPALFTIRSSDFCSRAWVGSSSPKPGTLTSPSRTSTFSFRNAPSFRPWRSCSLSKAGDSSTIFSNRRCAEVVRLRRINSVTLPIFGSFSRRSTSQTLPMKPVTPISKICRFANVSRTEKRSTRGASPKTATGFFIDNPFRAVEWMAFSSSSGLADQPSCLRSFSLEMGPSAKPLASHARGPRGRTTGSSNRPIALPLRYSSRFARNESTPR